MMMRRPYGAMSYGAMRGRAVPSGMPYGSYGEGMRPGMPWQMGRGLGGFGYGGGYGGGFGAYGRGFGRYGQSYNAAGPRSWRPGVLYDAEARGSMRGRAYGAGLYGYR